jgi:hypothetical protein
VTFLAALHAMMDEMLARPGQRPANVREEACIAELLPQIDRASRVPRATVPGDWRPVSQFCHENVDRRVADHPQWQAMRGWLIMDMSKACTLLGRPRFLDLLPHSVIRNIGSGKLADITPPDPRAAGDVYPFLPHIGTAEDFAQIVDGGQVGRVRIFVDETPPRIVCAPS